MNKIAGFMLLICFAIAGCKPEKSPWEGVWEMGRYYNAVSGTLEIKNCRDNVCEVDLSTINGMHMCSFSGKMKTNGKEAEYHKIFDFFENEPPKEAIVNFKLDEQKNIINIKCEGECRYFCGMQGYFEDDYENANNPLRFETSFDCWAKDLTDTEKTICAHDDLAQADKEMHEEYERAMTDEWKNNRAKCKKDADCLWEFYVNSVKNEYMKGSRDEINLYEYMGYLDEDKLYYPTDFILLDDYFRKNMEKDDYEEWKLAFGQISLDDNSCDECYYHSYGLPGLYTSIESAFYINRDEIWLAFLHLDDRGKEYHCITMYAPNGKTIDDIPEKYDAWLTRLKPYFPNDIELKHFKTPLPESKTSKVVKKFVDAIKTDDPKIIADYVVFPFERPNPLPDIMDKDDFIKKYSTLFDAEFKDAIVTSRLEDWVKMGWKGIMLYRGLLWLDTDGKLIAVNVVSDKDNEYIKEWYKKDKENIYKALKKYDENICVFETDTKLGRIDEIKKDDGDPKYYRLALWNKNGKMSEKPEIILSGGEAKYFGSANNTEYHFKSDKYIYIFFVNYVGPRDMPPFEFEIYEKTDDFDYENRIISEKANIIK